MSEHQKDMPDPLPCVRGLNRKQAAAYVGISPTKLDKLITDGRMPKPLHIDGRRIWDRLALDRAFERLAVNQ